MNFIILSILVFVWTSAEGDICPDLFSYCPGDETCCPSVEGYGCCPLPEAECCADLLHCCPDEYLCVVEYEICVKCPSVSENRCNSTTKYVGIKKAVAPSNICPGNQRMCPNGGLCCSDNLHCCPKGFTCNANVEGCTVNNILIPWSIPTLAKKANIRQCPDGGQCAEGNTCCLMANGEYGCCQFADAVCCSDKLHCCPGGSTCDVNRGQCIDEVHVIPWVEKKPSIKSRKP